MESPARGVDRVIKSVLLGSEVSHVGLALAARSPVGGHRNLPARGHARLPGDGHFVTACNRGSRRGRAGDRLVRSGLAAATVAPDPTRTGRRRSRVLAVYRICRMARVAAVYRDTRDGMFIRDELADVGSGVAASAIAGRTGRRSCAASWSSTRRSGCSARRDAARSRRRCL
jgi:hypothetical protein